MKWFVLALLSAMSCWCTAGEDTPEHEETSSSRISDEKIPLMEAIPQRPKPIIEWGDRLLGQGRIGRGFQLPTGAVWQPSLWGFGSLRSALQTFDAGEQQTTEWVNRLDLFGNLRLSGTERIVALVRPLDRNGSFSGYQSRPSDDWTDGANMDLRALYFEGDLSELFPRAGRRNGQPRQLGFVIGRQPLFIQEGVMINDAIDGVGFTRNNIPVRGTSNFRTSFLFGWNQVNRHNNQHDRSAQLFASLTEIGTYKNLYNVDLVYINADDETGSGAYFGISKVRPYGHINLALRVNLSHALDEETAAVGDGALLFAECSWTPPGTQNLGYINFFLGVDRFTSASRNVGTGGPVGRAGLLFASVGMGRYLAGLSNQATDVAGAVFGYQLFFNVRRQLIIEAGTRQGIDGPRADGVAAASRFQQALGQRFVLQADVFYSVLDDVKDRGGGRLELQYKF